ncbi:MAG: GDP-mannose 4,6-dehydratase [Nanoarchaeota archaeon]|nr:GDP-mannose 4,6-dehydratase [Nanoarchaeota archaeon]MBU1005611.1 GDP-mannose 4,6-dehydratase [Nanoarchaeota archaeon]MBU1945997.1 GDP-mannose 4,6-dehydratase [Nanoarchaeota archaeon]
MKALITGVSGFVGNYLTKELLLHDYEVYGVDFNERKIDDVSFFKADILDKARISDILGSIKPDIVFHLAAVSSVKTGWENPKLTFDVNVNGTKNILDAAGNKAKILVISSADVYGISKNVPIKEDSDLNPISPYGESKLKQEQTVLDYCKNGFNIVVSRSFTHTGPGQLPFYVCSEFAKQVVDIERGKRQDVSAGDLSVKRDFSDVRDIVMAYLMAVEKGESGEVYNICSGKGFALKEVLDILAGMSDAEIKVNLDKTKIRKNELPVLIGDNTKFCNATGWKPKIPLKQTLKDLLEYWRKN